MPQYAVIGTHPPESCPSSNKAVRDAAKRGMAKLPQLAQEFGVKVSTNIHLDPSHMWLTIAEAPNAEAVRDLLYKGGFAQWNDLTIYLATQIEELMKTVDDQPPIH